MKLKPIVFVPIVDKIAFLLGWGMDPEDEAAAMLIAVRQRLDSAIVACRCRLAYGVGHRYKLNFWIKLGGCDALVQIGPLQDRQKGGMRVCVNPSKFMPGDVELLHRTLRRLVGRSRYDRLIKLPLINVLHIAVDVENVSLSRTLVRYQHCQRMSIFGKVVNQKTGLVETMNFGSVTSDYTASVYDKRIERIHAAVVNLDRAKRNDDPLKANFIKQLKTAVGSPRKIRVEVRGQKMHALPLSKLPAMTNRLARFQFAVFGADPSKLPSLALRAFIAMAYQDGVKPALAAFKHTNYARDINRFWRQRQCGWWKPDELWSHVPAAVRATGLFPPDAFTALPDGALSPPRSVRRRRR